MNFATLAFGAILGRRLTPLSGSVRANTQHAVRIQRDAYGVAYVDAASEHDAWFGLGFCHAQDRSGQLEVSLRLVRGRLSEVLGPAGLDIDRASRLIGVHRAAQAQLETFDAATRAQLEAYCAGVNAVLTNRDLPRSHEHALLRCAPTCWQPADVVGFGLLMCCFLPSNWDVELARLLLLTTDGAEAVEALDPTWRADLPLTSPPGKASGPASDLFVARDLQALRAFVGQAGGSNAWAVQAHKSATGRPLLANDPHLPAVLPNLGYLTRVKCPAFAVAGVSIVGVPAFITGHNGHAAWGSTAAQVDNTDLFLEELSADGSQVREGGGWAACERHTEAIAVKGRADVSLGIIQTKRGTIVARAGDAAASIFEPVPMLGRANALAFAATWLLPRPTRALLGFHLLKNFDDFRRSCAASAGCAYSLIYADPTTVGWVLASELPRRKSGFGSLPLPGWEPDVGWEADIVSSAELPWTKNPQAGFVCCANNKPVADDPASAAEIAPSKPIFLGHDFLDGYRQQRLCEVLASRDDWTVERMIALQLDVQSTAFREVRASILALEAPDAPTARALELLSQWDGRVAGDSVAASVYELFLVELCQRVCQIKAPNSYLYAAGKGVMKLAPGTCWNARRASFVTRLIREQPPGYFESWEQALLTALASAMHTLRTEFGADERNWAWGEIRRLPLRHRFGDKKPLDKLFNLAPLRGWGDGTTVNQAGLEFWKPLRHSTVTAHLRAVFDVGHWGASRFVLLGGQSGNPFSPHYGDLVAIYQAGQGVPIHWDDTEVQKHALHTLTLLPATARPTAQPAPQAQAR